MRRTMLLTICLCAGACVCCAAGVIGCATKLETGYEPHRLGGLSADDRKAFYADPFSPEAHPPGKPADDGGGIRPGV